MMAGPDRRSEMGRAARARVLQHFSWTHIAQVTLEFYRDLIERRRREES